MEDYKLTPVYKKKEFNGFTYTLLTHLKILDADDHFIKFAKHTDHLLDLLKTKTVTITKEDFE